MSNSLKTFGCALGVAFGLGLAGAPSAAHAGFLDELFGAAPQAMPQAPGYAAPPPAYYEDRPVARAPRKRVVADAKPKLQKPTDLMHDTTLQAGDAVMMKGGLEVYTGDDGARHHDKDDFAKLDEVDGLSKTERKALVAMDTTRNDPLRGSIAPDTISSGRSAAVATPIVQGRKIVDARGQTVRYVGP